MLQLLQPIWMLSALGILVPVVIHLWNIRQGKVLKVGSIDFLIQSSKQYATSLKITERWLLLLRCLLIVLMALLLAKPQWKQQFVNSQEKGLFFIERQNLKETYGHFKPIIDSLVQAGYGFHYFNSGFTKLTLSDALQSAQDSIATTDISYRQLLQQLEPLVPSGLPICLFTPNYQNRFNGKRQPVALQLKWYTYTAADSTASFIIDGYAISGDSMRLVTGNSNPTGTNYAYTDIEIEHNPSIQFIKDGQDAGLQIRYKNGLPIPVDTSSLKITIYSDKYVTDAGYVEAAVKSIQQFSHRNIKLIVAHKTGDIPAMQDWMFWLSETPLPATMSARNVLKYEDGDLKSTHTWIHTGYEMDKAAEQISLVKMIAASPNGNSESVWDDGFGNSVLSIEHGSNTIYHLYTHLDPAWNDLPWSDQFPKLIFSLLYPETKTALATLNDKSSISNSQVIAVSGPVKEHNSLQKYSSKDLSQLFWIMVFIIFVAERLLSLKSKKVLQYA